MLVFVGPSRDHRQIYVFTTRIWAPSKSKPKMIASGAGNGGLSTRKSFRRQATAWLPAALCASPSSAPNQRVRVSRYSETIQIHVHLFSPPCGALSPSRNVMASLFTGQLRRRVKIYFFFIVPKRVIGTPCRLSSYSITVYDDAESRREVDLSGTVVQLKLNDRRWLAVLACQK